MPEPIGSILMSAGLVTAEQFERALAIHAQRGGPLGPIVAECGAATQAQIDRAWADAVVSPALEQAIDRECGNKFSGLTDRAIHYSKLHRVRRIARDMLAGAELSEATVEIEGAACLEINGRHSLEFEFNLDCASGFAFIADRGLPIVRRWFELLDRNGWLHEAPGETEPSPDAAPNMDAFAASVNKLLGDADAARSRRITPR